MESPDFKYLETKIRTAAPEELTIIIFDVLITASTKAIDKLRNTPGDIQGIHDELRRGQRALTLLMGSLNFDVGGELARNLFRVYEWWHHELVLANMRKDAERVERLLPHFRSYRETWLEANRRQRAQNAAVGVPVPAMTQPSGGGFVAVG
jgi:flagellar protein FliS